jgi:hypothetical protein
MPAAISLRISVAVCGARRWRQAAVPPHGHLPLDLNEIFDSDGDAVKRADGMAGSYGLIRGLGCKPGVASVDGDEGVEFRFQAFDAAQVTRR